VKVKICGITSKEDAQMCQELGADALGFVFVPGRRRSLTLAEISSIASSMSSSVPRVLVCAPRSVGEAEYYFVKSRADILQLHSLNAEDLDALREKGIPVIRAVPPERSAAVRFATHADALLFEQGKPGTGAAYDYSQAPVDVCRFPIIAGGLTLDNLDKAIEARPYALDVSSGVESAPGKKDRKLVSDFIRRCKA
jgi:phosphoribosylanthranilate isomerase